MATNTVKKRTIKYLNRDFEGLRQKLIQHLKTYFPNDYSDFNESSVGMMFTEIGAYVGDAFNFYLDKRFNESFIESSVELKNIFRHSKQLGFKAFGKTSAVGYVDAFLRLPAINNRGRMEADLRYARQNKEVGKIKKCIRENI